MRVLVSWIGHADFACCGNDRDEDSLERQEITEFLRDRLGRELRPPPGLGPVKTLLTDETFDAVYLISDAPENINAIFTDWLECTSTTVSVALNNPTDYAEIFELVDGKVKTILERHSLPRPELCFHLSPGTPAMAATWVLLGKSRYNATLFQTYRGKSHETRIPFDITVDVIPELLRNADSNLQALAAKPPADVPGFEGIAGDSQAIRLAVGRARQAALRDVPVLLLGESGTGKEMFAGGIHHNSHRSAQPCLTINCAAIPATLLESELFGHVKGAFTGAAARKGTFQLADGGTLFLDEIGECSLDMQAKLLRVLQPPPGEPPCTRVFRPVGGDTDMRSDVRVVAATNRDLHAMIRDGQFREDLYYRLAVITIRLPALRERKTDINAIANHLLAQINRDFAPTEPGYQDRKFSPGTEKFIRQHPWPGNVRQLYNAILQAAVMTDAELIGVHDLRAAVADMPGAASGALADSLDHPLGDRFDLDKHLDTIQRRYLVRAMRDADGKKKKAAELLGFSNYQKLSDRLRQLKVDWESDDDV